MGKSTPKPPDPYQTAAAQSGANKEAIQESAKVSAVDQFAPWGSDWATTNQYTNQWRSVYGEGHSLALTLEADADVTSLQWQGAHVLIRQTGI